MISFLNGALLKLKIAIVTVDAFSANAFFPEIQRPVVCWRIPFPNQQMQAIPPWK